MEGHVRKRHPKFFKRLTIGGSIFGVISIIAMVVVLILDIIGVNTFTTDSLRTYTATFISEDAVISETTYRRGEQIEKPAAPQKVMDGEKNYLFIGWDITGEGIPDIVPNRIYFNFTAKAVFIGLGDLHLSLEDLLNMDIDTLLKLLEDLNLDWETLAQMFGLSLEDLMALLQKEVFRFNSSGSAYVSYFRTTSYGDFNYKKLKYNKASYYDSNRVSENSINPLHYTADKLANAYTMGALLDSFGFVDYDITYSTRKSPLPVPDCEIASQYTNERIKSDAYSLETAADDHYMSQAAFCPGLKSVIDLLSLGFYSNNSIKQDELAYRQYARDNYLNVPNEYASKCDEMIASHGWNHNDYSVVDDVRKFVTSLGVFCMMDEETGKVFKNKDPFYGLLENNKGSDLDFNTIAVMVFRKLGIPARMVQGYLLPGVEQGENIVTLANQHYWCEVYVDNIGWMVLDCTECESMMGFNPYGDDYNNEDNPITDPIEEEEFIEDDIVSGDLSGEVSQGGPGDKLDEEDHDVFNFTSNYEGTVYFKSRAYSQYDGVGSWTEDSSYSEYLEGQLTKWGVSPLQYSYYVGEHFYYPQDFTVEYLVDMKYSLLPEYSYQVVDFSSDLHGEKDVKAGEVRSVSGLSVPLESYMISEMMNTGIENEQANYHEQAYREYIHNASPYYSYDSKYAAYFDQIVNNDLPSIYSMSLPNQIVAVKNYFQSNYTYNIDFDNYGLGADPVIGFLETKEGICNNFASATALFYRYLGIPSRFVTGYGAESLGHNQVNTVSFRNAHAWCEVYIDGVGWIMVDSTGFTSGQDNPSGGYGGGFGGGGTDQFEEKTQISTQIYVSYDNCGYTKIEDKYGYYYQKSYDGVNLDPDSFDLIITDEIGAEVSIRSNHTLMIDKSPLGAIGGGTRGDYIAYANVWVMDNQTGEDVTSRYYSLHNQGLSLKIVGYSLGQIDVSYNGPSSLADTPFTITSSDTAYFSVTHANPLLNANHVVTFIPDEVYVSGIGQYELRGRIKVYDSSTGQDVTNLYYDVSNVSFYTLEI